MHLGAYVLLLAVSAMAHYTGYETRNLILREQPMLEVEGTLVECPVCENPLSWLPSHEECDIARGNKKYKKCHMGTYVNEVCGNRLDCYRGPGDQCTEKMEVDVYGQKCAHGYYCDNTLHVCTGMHYTGDGRMRWFINHVYRYPLHPTQEQDIKTMLLA